MSKFKPGQSGNPDGRPKGLRDHRTVFLDALKEAGSNEEEFARSLVDKAREGNSTAIQVCAERLWKRQKPTLPRVQVPEGKDSAEQAQWITQAVVSGEISADHGAAMVAMLRGAAELTELADIRARLEALES